MLKLLHKNQVNIKQTKNLKINLGLRLFLVGWNKHIYGYIERQNNKLPVIFVANSGNSHSITLIVYLIVYYVDSAVANLQCKHTHIRTNCRCALWNYQIIKK